MLKQHLIYIIHTILKCYDYLIIMLNNHYVEKLNADLRQYFTIM